MLDLIAFDADDTLWQNESLYQSVESRFCAILGDYVDEESAKQFLLETEKRNIQLYGYGIKSFGLSLIEATIMLSQGEFESSKILPIIVHVKGMLTSGIELLDHALHSVECLAKDYPLMLITKGDVHDQERKLQESGLQASFQYVEIVPEKDEQLYARLLEKHNVKPHRFLMVGNSMRSDILPVLAIGAQAVYIPHVLNWQLEEASVPQEPIEEYHELTHIGELPALIKDVWGG